MLSHKVEACSVSGISEVSWTLVKKKRKEKKSHALWTTPPPKGVLKGTLMFLLNRFKFMTHPEGDKSIPKDPMIFAVKMSFVFV